LKKKPAILHALRFGGIFVELEETQNVLDQLNEFIVHCHDVSIVIRQDGAARGFDQIVDDDTS
jgi:hypothetical protein